jgi:hypothetical protein
MKLGITEFIDCAHFLPGHPKCGQLHGHTYSGQLRERISFPMVIRVWEGRGKWAEMEVRG